MDSIAQLPFVGLIALARQSGKIKMGPNEIFKWLVHVTEPAIYAI